jgi:hypothetical protein
LFFPELRGVCCLVAIGGQADMMRDVGRSLFLADAVEKSIFSNVQNFPEALVRSSGN